MKDQTI